jgi:exonuclease V gamma subunit
MMVRLHLARHTLPVREVEALYNYLVHLVTHKKNGIAARDIVVMVSDIDVYAPYIKAIFSNAPYTFRTTLPMNRMPAATTSLKLWMRFCG